MLLPPLLLVSTLLGAGLLLLLAYAVDRPYIDAVRSCDCGCHQHRRHRQKRKPPNRTGSV